MRKKWQCKHGRFAYEYCAECQEPAQPSRLSVDDRRAAFMAGAGAFLQGPGRWLFDAHTFSPKMMAEAYAAWLAQRQTQDSAEMPSTAANLRAMVKENERLLSEVATLRGAIEAYADNRIASNALIALLAQRPEAQHHAAIDHAKDGD
jgi:hypothetical protein